MSRGRKNALCLVIIGIALIAVPVLLRRMNDDRTRQYIEAFEEKEKDDGEGKEKKKTDKKEDPLLSKEGVIGIIEIPELSLKYPIFEGAGSVQLNEGIGHMENTAPLCKPGNCVLAGHNGSRRATYFTYLNTVHTGTEVKITNKEKVTHTYTVRETRVVSPYDGWVTETDETERLTLFTCAEHGTRRFVCKCELKESEEPEKTAGTDSETQVQSTEQDRQKIKRKAVEKTGE